MSSPAIISLSQLFSNPAKMGRVFHQLLKIESAGLPLTPTMAISENTSQQIILDNKQVLTEIVETYNQKLGADFVRIIGSQTQKRVENIKGDANLLDSLKSFIKDNEPQTLLIQAQPQPEVSGVTFTSSLATPEKSQFLIHAVPGVHTQDSISDSFVVDVKTGVSSQNNIATKKTKFVRTPDELEEKNIVETQQSKPSLSPKQISQLTDLSLKAKQLFFKQQKIDWELIGGKFFISGIEPIEVEVVPDSNLDSTQSKKILQGICLKEGKVEGKVYILDQKIPKKIASGSILVSSSFNSDVYPLLKYAVGVISENPITDPKITTFINDHHLPTIIRTPLATKKLTTGKKVVLAASDGCVLDLPQSTNKTITDVLSRDKALENYDYYHQPNFNLDKNPVHKVINDQLGQLINNSQIADQIFYRLGIPDQGSWNLLHHLDSLENHFTVIEGWQKKILKPCNLVIPFVRSSQELMSIVSKINSQKFPHHISIWLELATPLNFHQIEDLLRPALTGFIIRPDLLFPHLMNTNPGTDQSETYTFNALTTRDYYWEPLQKVKTKTKLIMDLKEYDPQLVIDAVHLHMSGVIVKSSLAQITKQRVADLETEVLEYGHN